MKPLFSACWVSSLAVSSVVPVQTDPYIFLLTLFYLFIIFILFHWVAHIYKHAQFLSGLGQNSSSVVEAPKSCINMVLPYSVQHSEGPDTF